MIRISKIDSELSVYKEKKVVVCGGAGKGANGEIIQEKLLEFGIKIHALCDSIPSLWGEYYNDIPIISPEQLKSLAEEHDDVVVQIASSRGVEDELIRFIKTTKVSEYVHCDEAINMLNLLKHIELFKIDTSFRDEVLKSFIDISFTNKRTQLWSYFVNHKEQLCLLLPTNAGDLTLNSIFANQNVLVHNMQHVVGAFNKNFLKINDKKVKFITAVRDPIAQNLSMTYQFVSNLSSLLLLHDDTKLSEFLKDGGDAQEIFDITTFDLIKYMEEVDTAGTLSADSMTSAEIYDYLMTRIYYIQRFIPEFQEQILDIMKEPFDKEKGYAVIEDENVEVFVYQLERLYDIAPALSEFTGVKINDMALPNLSGDKWCDESFRQAQEDIRFSQEYFDKCYDEPYVKHFYSEEDIEKFKKKWENNIK